jgi:RNA polymerase sigma factor (sigma-70 family)
MATGAKSVFREMRTLFHLGAVGSLGDGQLLEAFLSRRGEEAEDAFAAVVERHGPMVLRVCRRILMDPNDADDAFQVTFLVLARKARSIARRERLANWLYGVAVRTAKEVRKSAARRRVREGPMGDMARAEAPREQADTDELRFVIDDELSRLPESFRAPVVLCDLEGKTQREAAALLGVPVGTLSSRLSRGRNRLRRRLTRRGLALPTSGLAVESLHAATPVVVSPALVASTAKAAVRFAIEGSLAGTVPAYLATITQGVLKTMLLAKLTSKGFILATILSLSVGAVAVGVVAYAQRGDGPEPFTSSGAAVRDWAWVGDLHNADAATKERLKRCASSATANFASLHRLIFDYDLTTEAAQLPLDASGKLKGVDRGSSHGTVYWRDGSVRYDDFPVGKFGPNGEKLIYKRPMIHSVVRSQDMLAHTEQNAAYGLVFTVVKPPRSAEEWEHQNPFAPRKHLDPWLHYARPFCADRKQLREFLENCRAIESEESGGKVLLRFLLANNKARVEVTCDESADWLPVRLRTSDMRDGKWNVIFDLSSEWRKISGVWYPIHQVKTVYYRIDLRTVKEIDLTVRNLRANGAAKVPESVFTLSAMSVPEGTGGLDKRQEPHRWLIRAGGVVRETRHGEGPRPMTVQEMDLYRQQGEEVESPSDPTTPVPQAAGSSPPGAAKSLAAKQDYDSLLDEYESVKRAGDKTFREAKSEQDQRAAYLALGRLDWSYAPRFLALARKYPGDPVAIDALGGLVASQFTPPEANEAAEILIRDHLKSDKLIPIYHQLVTTLYPAPSSAAERLLRTAAEHGPTPAARGLACLKLAELLSYRSRALLKQRGPEPDPFMKLEDLARSGGREPVKRSDEDPDALSQEAEQFYDRVVKEYVDIAGTSGTLGEVAAKALFHLRVLAVGKPALEAEGPDADGKPFRLSDYRGKVVVLTFAGRLRMDRRDIYAHVRALVQRMKGRPFVLVSVNLDEDKAAFRSSIDSGEITWRCWWEGNFDGPNRRRWQLDFVPSVYVIDADGVIRAKDVHGKALDQAVDALVAELEARTRAKR